MSNPASRTCQGFGAQPPHDVPYDSTHLGPWAMDLGRKNVRCRDCDREYRRSRRSARSGQAAPAKAAAAAEQSLAGISFAAKDAAAAADVDVSTDGEYVYVPDPELVQLFTAAVKGTLDHGDPPINMVFFGPPGSGKTEGAKYLAEKVDLPFTKVDAASMTDPEAWFGTREIIVEQGVSVTKYVPSAFVEAIQQPGVSFIDEVTRTDDQHRNILLPLMDGTGRVTNPLTGEVIVRHDHHFMIMAGNRGLQFTGTSAVDVAFTTRAVTVEFDYLAEAIERDVVQRRTQVDALTAQVFVAFANETRAKAKADPDFPPISTREVIQAARLVKRGLDRDLAAKFAILNQSSGEGGDSSIRSAMETIWGGVRLAKEELSDPDASAGWVCPVHNKFKTVPAGTSTKSGQPRPYPAFRACPEAFCDEAEPRAQSSARASAVSTSNTANVQAGLTCPSCKRVNPPGRVTYCTGCGGRLQ